MSSRPRRGRAPRNEPSETGSVAPSVAPSVGAGSLVSFFTANSGGTGASVRDRRILQLEDEAVRLRTEVQRERSQRKKESVVHDMELKKLRGQKAAAEKRNEILMRDMDDRNAISHYAAVIKKASPQAIDSTYVLKLQSQLAKAMHRMGALENQVALAEQACEGVVKNLEKEVEKVIDRTSKMEADYSEQVKKHKADARKYRDEAAKLKEANSKSEVEFMSQIMKIEDENRALRKEIASCRAELEDSRRTRHDSRGGDGLPSDFLFTSESSESDHSRKGDERSNDPSNVWGLNIQVGATRKQEIMEKNTKKMHMRRDESDRGRRDEPGRGRRVRDRPWKQT